MVENEDVSIQRSKEKFCCKEDYKNPVESEIPDFAHKESSCRFDNYIRRFATLQISLLGSSYIAHSILTVISHCLHSLDSNGQKG